MRIAQARTAGSLFAGNRKKEDLTTNELRFDLKLMSNGFTVEICHQGLGLSRITAIGRAK
jgi:hypothetical protein